MNRFEDRAALRAFLRTFILYGIIGAISAGTDALLFYLLFRLVGVNEYLANLISTHAGIFLSFLLNRNFNFKKKDQTGKRFVSFYLTGLFGLALSSGLLKLGNYFGFDPLIVKLFAIVIVAVVQFFINRVVAFGDTKTRNENADR